MATISDVQIANAAFAAGFGRDGDALARPMELATAIAIALGESGGNPRARCKDCFAGIAEDSRGLWQINMNAHPQYLAWGDNIYNPQWNARAAWEVSGAGKTFRPWTVYKTGAYNAYLPRAVKAVEIGPGAATGADTRDLLDKVQDVLSAGAGTAAGVVLGPIGGPAAVDAIGAGANAVGTIDDAADVLGILGRGLRALTSPAFWKVAGLVLSGVALILGGIALLLRDNVGRLAGEVIGAAT